MYFLGMLIAAINGSLKSKNLECEETSYVTVAFNKEQSNNQLDSNLSVVI